MKTFNVNELEYISKEILMYMTKINILLKNKIDTFYIEINNILSDLKWCMKWIDFVEYRKYIKICIKDICI